MVAHDSLKRESVGNSVWNFISFSYFSLSSKLVMEIVYEFHDLSFNYHFSQNLLCVCDFPDMRVRS